MIASLPMYDLPPLQGANDRFWQAIRAELGTGPETLLRDGAVWEHWQAPELILSQTCGYPYRARLHGHVTLVGTPDYGLPGCPAGHYNSVLIVRADAPGQTLDDFAGQRFAYNEAMSQSGWAAPQHHAAGQGVRFGPLVETGGHRFSAHAVAEGRADIAGIDALTWELLLAHDDVTDALRVIGRTAPTPALPFITAAGREGGPVFDAIAAAIEGLSREDAAALHLRGILRIPAEAYLAVPTPPAPEQG